MLYIFHPLLLLLQLLVVVFQTLLLVKQCTKYIYILYIYICVCVYVYTFDQSKTIFRTPSLSKGVAIVHTLQAHQLNCSSHIHTHT